MEKNGNRWVLTALGRQINFWTRSVAKSQKKIFNQQKTSRNLHSRLPDINKDSALVLVNVQNGFDDPIWGARNNIDAEENIAQILSTWRSANRPVYHVQHHSKEPSSPLKWGTYGASFKTCAIPIKQEIVIEKFSNSAFVGTNFETTLRKIGHQTLVIAGFTTNHCISATIISAEALGFSAFVVEDACVAFDRVYIDGTLVKAHDTHRVVMANLNQEFANIVDTEILLKNACAPNPSFSL